MLVVGNRWQDSPLARAERVDNYLGLPGVTGMELLEQFRRHAEELGADFVPVSYTHLDVYKRQLTYCDFPSEHWTRIRTNNVIERLNREIRRRTRVVEMCIRDSG